MRYCAQARTSRFSHATLDGVQTLSARVLLIVPLIRLVVPWERTKRIVNLVLGQHGRAVVRVETRRVKELAQLHNFQSTMELRVLVPCRRPWFARKPRAQISRSRACFQTGPHGVPAMLVRARSIVAAQSRKVIPRERLVRPTALKRQQAVAVGRAVKRTSIIVHGNCGDLGALVMLLRVRMESKLERAD